MVGEGRSHAVTSVPAHRPPRAQVVRLRLDAFAVASDPGVFRVAREDSSRIRIRRVREMSSRY